MSYKENVAIKFAQGFFEIAKSGALDVEIPQFQQQNEDWFSMKMFTRQTVKCFRLKKQNITFEPTDLGQIEIANNGQVIKTTSFQDALEWIENGQYKIKTGYELELAVSKGFTQLVLLTKHNFSEEFWQSSFEVIHKDESNTDLDFCEPINAIELRYLPLDMLFINDNNLIRVKLLGQLLPFVFEDGELAFGMLEAGMMHLVNLQNVKS